MVLHSDEGEIPSESEKRAQVATQPCHFGPPSARLFGVYETLLPAAPQDLGVVLCPPLDRDYVAAFRAYRVLGARLARAGFAVLRFDFSGCGDSWGDLEDASVNQWIDDVAAATECLRDLRGRSPVALVGLRLGATLATLAASQSQTIDRLVLWEPVTSGAAYLDALAARHRAWLDGELRARPHARALRRDDELLGYRFTEALRADVRRVTLSTLAKAPSPDVLVLSEDPASHQELIRQLWDLGSNVDTGHDAGPRVWGTSPGMDNALVPNQTLQGIVSWLEAGEA